MSISHRQLDSFLEQYQKTGGCRAIISEYTDGRTDTQIIMSNGNTDCMESDASVDYVSAALGELGIPFTVDEDLYDEVDKDVVVGPRGADNQGETSPVSTPSTCSFDDVATHHEECKLGEKHVGNIDTRKKNSYLNNVSHRLGAQAYDALGQKLPRNHRPVFILEADSAAYHVAVSRWLAKEFD